MYIFSAKWYACRAAYCYSKWFVFLSVRPSFHLSMMLRYRDHIGWKSPKIISQWSIVYGGWIYLLMNWIDKRVDDYIKYYYRIGAHLGLTSSIKHYSPVASSLAFGRLPQQPQLQQHRFVAAAAANSFYYNVLSPTAVRSLQTPTSRIYFKGNTLKFWPKWPTTVELGVADIR